MITAIRLYNLNSELHDAQLTGKELSLGFARSFKDKLKRIHHVDEPIWN